LTYDIDDIDDPNFETNPLNQRLSRVTRARMRVCASEVNT